MKRLIDRRVPALMVCLMLMMGLMVQPARAAVGWPEDVSISAEGGILMDADSGAILYGKNIHTAYYPASITKILTALVVIENCNLDEVVTFSHDAVFNVEAGSSSAALDVGDQLTVRECLYAMVLKSANEAANALAEHTAGSVPAFAEMMNNKAVSLGCTDSHFNNPSGLNDPDHYTSAHDMALIAQAAFENETFVEIDSKLYHDLPPTKRNPDGLRIYPGHQMLKKNNSRYYPGIIGGKTGYTSLAGNTLVTCAERDGLKLIAVVLNGHQTHYTDTRTLLNFGFQNFKTVNPMDFDTSYAEAGQDITIAGLPATNLSILGMTGDCRITLPLNADYSDITSTISYELSDRAPDDAVAQIRYSYADRQVGTAYLLLNKRGTEVSETEAEVASTAAGEEVGSGQPESEDVTGGEAASEVEDLSGAGDENPSGTGRMAGAGDENPSGAGQQPADDMEAERLPVVWILCVAAIILVIVVAVFVLVKIQIEKREEEERLARYRRRQQRLQDIGMSTAEFDMLLEQKRNASAKSHRPEKKRREK